MIEEKQKDLQTKRESFSQRVKKRREELHITQDGLARLVWPDIFSDDNMSEKARDTKRKCIVGYENGKYPKDPDVYLSLCNALDCDMGYLFGEHDCKTKDLQGVCDYTGLTESAVEQLHFYTKPGFQHIAEMLSSLISDEFLVERDTKELSSTIHVLADNISYLRQTENGSISYGERDEMEFFKAGTFGKCQLAFMGFIERYTRFQGLEDKKT